MSARRVTMRMIAEAAGVSATTVSQVLNNKSGNYSSEAIRVKIRSVADALGYRQNIGYKLMHSMPTHTVGIMISSPYIIQEEHIKNLLLQLMAEFGRREYAVFSDVLPNTPESARERVRQYVARGTEHFIFIGQPFGDRQIQEDLRQRGITFVGNDASLERFVIIDNVWGALQLFAALEKKCGRDFRLVAVNDLGPNGSRFRALQQLFPDDSQEQLRAELIRTFPRPPPQENYFENLFRSGYRMAAEIIEREPEVRGIAFMNDTLALGGATLLMEKHRTLYLTGFNDDEALRFFPFPVSTARQESAELVRLLIENSLTNEPCAIRIRPDLILRGLETSLS